jgi:hypothetical protein
MRLAASCLLAALLGGCAGSGGCGAVLANASAQPVEQFYLAPAGTAGWGADLLSVGSLPSGATMPIRFAARGAYGVRAVWANGRAAEMQGVDGCRTTRITIRDASLLAE